MKKIIFHVDVNSAFLSWENAHLRKTDPSADLLSIPSAVGNEDNTRTGIILAKSPSAKKMGVVTGEPVGMAKKKCPSLKIVAPTPGIYNEYSKAFVEILKKYSDNVEQFSVDECFLDYTASKKIFGDEMKMAQALQREIKDSLDFTVNIGIATNKLLAKMASEFEKPNKIHTLYEDEIPMKLWPLKVDELFMVGRRTAEKLREMGIETIGELAHSPIEPLIKAFKAKRALWLSDAANGRDCPIVTNELHKTKSIGNSTTTSKDVETKKEANKIILALCDKVSYRLRSCDLLTSTVSVEVKTKDFFSYSKQMSLPCPTCSTSEIYLAATKVFDALWQGEPLRLLGVSVSGLKEKSKAQVSLFEDARSEKEKKIDAAVDRIRKKYGGSLIKPAALLEQNGYNANSIKDAKEDMI